MKLIFKILSICAFTTSCYAQVICDLQNKDLSDIMNKSFETLLVENDSIVLRNNFKTICLEKSLKNDKIKIWNERKLFNALYEDFYSIEEVFITHDFAKVVYIQRSKNLIFKIFLYKNMNEWDIINSYKWQARIKGDDFLLISIKEEILKKEG